MLKTRVLAAFMAVAACVPAYAQDAADKGKQWCNDAHMKMMDDSVAKMTDPAKQKDAQKHLAASKKAMKANDTVGCVKQMEKTHKAMGL